MHLSRISCIECKGRYCNNYSECPLFSQAKRMMRSVDLKLSTTIQSQSPAPFVGQYGYPNVGVGILAPPQRVDDARSYDDPRQWAKDNLGIPQIVAYRSSLVNSRFQAQIKDVNNRLLDISREVAMASRPVDVDINLERAPVMRLTFDPQSAPLGPAARLKSASLTSNPHVSSAVEKVVEDTDLKASKALVYLYKKGFDENVLMRMFSVGTLGVKANRKLVPTRWSITATDDTLGKAAIETVKTFSNQLGYTVYFGGYLGNYYLLLFFPDVWSYELFETYVKSSRWLQTPEASFSTDYENVHGRKEYAHSTAGGYYSVRLAIADHLVKLKRQGSCLVLRFITDEYAAPLGVWVTREAARKALNNEPIEFSSKELMLHYAEMKIKKQFGMSIAPFVRSSNLLGLVSSQRKLKEF